MAHDPVADDADAAVLDWETGLPPIKHEDLPRIVQQKIAEKSIPDPEPVVARHSVCQQCLIGGNQTRSEYLFL